MNAPINRPSWAIVIALALLCILCVSFIAVERLPSQKVGNDDSSFVNRSLATRNKASQTTSARDMPVNREGGIQGILSQQSGSTGVSIDKSIRAQNPDGAALRVRGQERTVQKMLGSLIDGLGLPNDTAVQLRQLLVERRMAVEDQRNNAREQGITDKAAIDSNISAATGAIDGDIAQLLGPDMNGKLQSRLALADEYNAIQNYVGLDMSFAGVPLTQDQQLLLAEAMNALHYSPFPAPSTVRLTALANPGTNVNQDVLAKAAEILTPAQFAIFKSNQEDKIKEEAIIRAEVLSMKNVIPR